MAQAKKGDVVQVHYTGTLEDGSQFDSSAGGKPLQFKIGAGHIIPGFEEAVTGMAVGETKTVTIEADQAYGKYRPELIQEFDRGSVPADLKLEIGTKLEAEREDGGRVILTVLEATESIVRLDANHPLAGKDLTFEIELVEIAA